MSAESATVAYLLTSLISVIFNVVFLCIIFFQKERIKDSLKRRDSSNTSEEQQTRVFCSRECGNYCRFEDEIIPELRNDAERWKSLYMEEQKINSILESTNAKLRLRNMEEQNND